MSPLVRPRTAPALIVTRGLVAAGAVVLALAAAGCTSSPDPVAVPSAAASSAATSAPAPSTSASTSPSTSASASASESPEASTPADAVSIDITIADGKVSPSGDSVDVKKGQTVVLNITSDVDEEVHAHDAGDGVEIEAKAGQTVTGEIVANDVGRFEVETHSDGQVIVFLNVR